MHKYTGTIQHYSRERTDESFVFSVKEQGALGASAAAAAVFGATAQAGSLAIMSSDVSEPADWVTFELGDKKFQGYLWRCPFKNGDKVEVAAIPEGDHCRLFAVFRPHDRLIALYPHCSRGALAHWKAVFKGCIPAGIKWWGGGVTFMAILLMFFTEGNWQSWLSETIDFMLLASIIVSLFTVFFSIVMGLQWLRFVRVAEDIFRTFGWPNPASIDLVARAKATPLDCDESNIPVTTLARYNAGIVTDVEYGLMFFRY